MKNTFIILCILFHLSVWVPIFFLLPGTQHSTTHKTIICTTTILADTVRAIAGTQWSVQYLMGPGVDPHTYHAKESDIHRLTRADIIFYHGLHLEGKIAHVFEHMNEYVPSIGVCNTLDRAQLYPCSINNIYDPHVWHDVHLWKQVVHFIAQKLSSYDTDNAKLYKERCILYIKQLDELDSYITKCIKQLNSSQRTLITAHDAFEYFGKRYGMKVIGIQGISTQTEPGTKDIQEVVTHIVKYKTKAIFVESSTSARNIQAVQEAAHAHGHTVNIGPELYTDSLGLPGSNADTYITMMKHNIDSIVHSLST